MILAHVLVLMMWAQQPDWIITDRPDVFVHMDRATPFDDMAQGRPIETHGLGMDIHTQPAITPIGSDSYLLCRPEGGTEICSPQKMEHGGVISLRPECSHD